MTFVQTLYGHQAPVTTVACRRRERPVSAGVDRTLRVWRTRADTQLVFRGQMAAIDCVDIVKDDVFVSGGQDGALALWSTRKKKPADLVQEAHGQEEVPDQGSLSITGLNGKSGKEGKAAAIRQVETTWGEAAAWTGKHGVAPWISSVAVLPGTDLVASGSCDGRLRFWVADVEELMLDPLEAPVVHVPGFVNAIRFAPSGRFVAVAAGREHRAGRWMNVRGAPNAIHVFPLPVAAWR